MEPRERSAGFSLISRKNIVFRRLSLKVYGNNGTLVAQRDVNDIVI